MAERAINTLVKDYNFNRNYAELFVSDVFDLIDSVTKEKGYKSMPEEKKAELAIAGAVIFRQDIRERIDKLKLNTQ